MVEGVESIINVLFVSKYHFDFLVSVDPANSNDNDDKPQTFHTRSDSEQQIKHGKHTMSFYVMCSGSMGENITSTQYIASSLMCYGSTSFQGLYENDVLHYSKAFRIECA